MLDAKEAAPISQTIPEAEKNKAEEKSISETPGAIAATVSNPEEQPSSVLTAATEEKTEENKKGTSNDAKSEEEKSETSPIFQTSPVQIPDISTLDPSSANKTTPAPFPGKAPSPLPAPPLTRAADSRITLTTTSNPDTQISDSSERIIYATTLSHTDATKPIDGGKLVITVENGKFNTIPAVMDHQDILKTATLSSDGKTITLEFKDGMVSGNYNSFTYSAYAAVGIPAGANVTVKSVFTGNFKGETAAFENESEKSVTADFVGIKPVVPGSTSWKPYALASKVLHPGVRVEMSQGIQNPNNVPEGFSNLQFKIEFSDSTKVDWFKNNYLGKYFLQLRGGGQKSVALSADQIKKIDDKTYILTIGEINPSEVSHVYLYPHITPPADAAAGDAFDVKQTILENDTEINSHSTHFTVEGKQTELSFDAIRGGNAQLKPGQDFSTAYKVEGVTTDPVNDHVTEITVPSEVVTKKVLNGILSGTTKNVKSVEYLSASSWKEVAKNADGDFDLPDVPIEKLRINYVSVNGQVRNYQAFRVFWKLKDDAADGTAIKLKHQVSYTDANGVKQMPDVSAQDLSYTVKADAVSAATKAGVYQYNRSSREFDQGTVLSGDSFTMNYRLAAMAGELEQPYVFVKVPKGIEVQNLYNTIQYPYGNRISYVYAPSNGRTVTPISQANNVGSFEAADGSTVYYFKANDTKLVKEDYIQQLFIENKYIAKNIESGIYEVEVGMGSLKENYEDVSLASGYSKSSLSAELQFKLGSAATTYYSKKTKMTVGKVDKVTTGVSVKGSEDSAWLDASKTGKVVPGKKVSYRVSIKNEGTENYSDVQLVNLLPYVGDTLVSSSAPRNSQFQINPDSSGVSVKLNGKATSDVVLEYSLSNNPVRFSSPNGDPIGADAWVGAVSDYSKVRAIRVAAPSMTLKPGDEITLEYSGVVVLDAQRPQNDTDSYKANNSVAYRFVTADGEVRAGEPSVSTVATTKAVNDGLISGSSYIDLNKNGSKDVGEPGLNQLSLELFKKNSSGQFVSTGVTSESSSNSAGDNGIFGFTDLDYGTYKVKVKLPNTKGAAFITTGADKLEKIDDTTAWLVLNGSSEFILNDSTSTSHQMKDLRVPIFVNTPLTGSINFKNKAGAVVGSDYGKGFTVDLYKGTTKVATTTSGAAGVYTFEGLTIDSKETYTLKFTFPSGKQYDYTADNSNGELTIELEPGIGTADRTDLYITDT
ncbi:MAG: hypothetical protein LBV19_04240, partial [Streptococcaceae bacterium]|nr:hypothetical protein [Streptococcaceae bacterium]